MRTHRTVPGIIQVEATAQVVVSYDAALNMIEIIERGKVVRSEVCPKGYTASAFVQTLSRVKAYYSKN